jgi:hypothetical protein
MVSGDEQYRSRRHPIKVFERREQHHLSGTRPPKGRRRTRVLAAGRAVIVVKLFVDVRRFLGECLWRSDGHRSRCAVHFSLTLFEMSARFFERSGIDSLQTLAVCLADVIHAHYGLDARVGFRRGQTKAATAADAMTPMRSRSTKDFVPRKSTAALKSSINASTAVKCGCPPLAVVRGIVRDSHKAALRHRLSIQPRACSFTAPRPLTTIAGCFFERSRPSGDKDPRPD